MRLEYWGEYSSSTAEYSPNTVFCHTRANSRTQYSPEYHFNLTNL